MTGVFIAEAGFSSDFIDLVDVLGLIVAEEHREQKGICGFLAVEHGGSAEKQRCRQQSEAGGGFGKHGSS
jgi:hypothetical protein